MILILLQDGEGTPSRQVPRARVGCKGGLEKAGVTKDTVDAFRTNEQMRAVLDTVISYAELNCSIQLVPTALPVGHKSS